MNIEKHVIQTAKKHREKPEEIFKKFIEMTYQLNATTTYDIKYKYLEAEQLEFRLLLLKAVRDKPFTDVLGEAMMDIISFDKKGLGQCMSPSDISNLMGSIQAEMHLRNNPNKQKINFGDDTGCGTGGLVLSALGRLMKSNAKTLNIFINDIDEMMVKIALIQLQYNDGIHNPDKAKEVNICAYNGNALTGYDKPENLVFHPNVRLIQEPYVKGYYEHVDQLQREDVFSTLLNRFKDTEQQTNKAA
ncbi:hypothetical protein AB4218_23185 [Vibrio splendidus]